MVTPDQPQLNSGVRPVRSPEPEQLDLQPALQAAGHAGAQQGEGLFIKPTMEREIDFYQRLLERKSPLLDFVPNFMGTLTSSESSQKLIVLEDLCNGLTNANVLDVKLGSILFDREATAEKQLRLTQVSNSTTSGSLRFRIAGMSLWTGNGRQSFEKQYGRSATIHDIEEKLAAFFPNLESSDHVLSVLRYIVSQLHSLRKILAKEPLELHSSSILLVYEGDMDSLRFKLDHQDDLGEDDRLVEVRLIDFSHAWESQTPDLDTIQGLDRLIRTLENIENKAA